MKFLKKSITLLNLLALFIISIINYNTIYSQNKVLVEVFTNSHCGPCGTSYNYMNNNVKNQNLNENLIFIYHHVSTYQDDKLYQESRSFSNPRAQYYGNIAGTPTYFVNGKKLNNYTTISNEVNLELAKNSILNMNSKVILQNNKLLINSNIIPNISGTYSINHAVVEDIIYKGRNGVEDHKNVMRNLNPSVSGKLLDLINSTEINNQNEINLDPIWNLEKLSIIVWIQNPTSKEIMFSTIIPYSSFETAMSLDDETKNLVLYPNPVTDFFQIQNIEVKEVTIYDILGNKFILQTNNNKVDVRSLVKGSYKAEILDNNNQKHLYQFIKE